MKSNIGFVLNTFHKPDFEAIRFRYGMASIMRRTSMVLLAWLAVASACAQAQTKVSSTSERGDEVILEMAQAHKKADGKRLATLLPSVRGHALEPWAAYWDMNLKLGQSSPEEVQAFFAAFPNTYQEDRLRNDWLLLLGSRRDWGQLEREYPRFRMNDDRNVRCYVLAAQHLREQKSVLEEVKRLWYAQNENEEACNFAAESLFDAKKLTSADVWRKARLATEANRPRSAQNAVEMLEPRLGERVQQLFKQAVRVISVSSAKTGLKADEQVSEFDKEMAVLALIRLADKDAEEAAEWLNKKWLKRLNPEQLSWAWGAIGKAAARRLSDQALDYFAQAPQASSNEEHSQWRIRAALRAGKWRQVLQGTQSLGEELRRDPAWVYWRARALAAVGNEADKKEAQAVFKSLASARGFYEQLATEELGLRISVPPKPAALAEPELQAAKTNAGLLRALYAMGIGLRSEGVREWNYSVNLAKPGGLSERELLAAAALACEHLAWDRCINTSERTRSQVDWSQRFPMPERALIEQNAKESGLDPAYVFGLIRQESRFIVDAKSNVGAAGLMQVMPKTAAWTAKKIGFGQYSRDKLHEPSVNVLIGTSYLKLVLDDMQGSLPLAAAAYNAGPSRPRAWRQGPVLEAAIWAENIPFAETRDYVKKVLANTTSYAALMTGQPQSIKERLGQVGPRDTATPAQSLDLP
jgi:soluble lytic murein transglycosylase